MRSLIKQYLDQLQDKDRHESKDLPGMRHGNPLVWLRSLDSHQGELRQVPVIPRAVSAAEIMGVRLFDFVSNASISSATGLGYGGQ